MTIDLLPEYDYSVETLIHYRHRSCPASGNNWWSVSNGLTDRDLYCPNCGQRLTPVQYPDDLKPTHEPEEIEL